MESAGDAGDARPFAEPHVFGVAPGLLHASADFSSASSDFKAFGAFFCNFTKSEVVSTSLRRNLLFEGILGSYFAIPIYYKCFQNQHLHSPIPVPKPGSSPAARIGGGLKSSENTVFSERRNEKKDAYFGNPSATRPRLDQLDSQSYVQPWPQERRVMSITVNIGDAKARLSELVARAEAGEEVIIARDNSPVARLSRLARDNDVRAAIDEIRAARAGLAPTSADEILQWRDEGCRF